MSKPAKNRGRPGPSVAKQKLEALLTRTREMRDWAPYANCLGADPDLFFPERGASTREAKEVCRACSVREDCLEFALANGEGWGIWGGTSGRDRRKIRRQRAIERQQTTTTKEAA